MTLPISFQGSRKCPVVVQKSVYKSNTAQLAKMERSKELSEGHGEKMLANISEKLKQD